MPLKKDVTMLLYVPKDSFRFKGDPAAAEQQEWTP